ncbi:MAG: tRNA 2-thiouridine(34) synthase MnmA [Clostridia bacterium]|nr:tRNA 2-thiouridine(34) synthase MnmA [Clostridia bacterium]MDY2930076.1 tRNA 2-thiouridine(34) synthase MnmA [Clostridiaceae bacterium]
MANVYAAMSGGVDSSAAALLAVRAGDRVTGVTLRLHDHGGCGSEQDAADAQAVCAALGAGHRIWDARDLFLKEVVDPFAQSYLAGNTPNPCIRCNTRLKFGFFLDKALEEGAEYIITGHYARVQYDEARGRWLLKKGLSEQKDQSYVLYTLTQHQLAHLRLPLGEMDKEAVRALAREAGFANCGKPDSQDICFVPDGAYARFIWEHTGHTPEPGDFIDIDGCILGQHAGIECYTIGQRKGVGLSGAHPYYVVAKNADRNTVMLGEDEDLWREDLTAGELNWIAFDALTAPLRCAARTRYHQAETPCTVTPGEEGQAEVRFDKPVRAITPGQAVVFYDGDVVLGGGTIL